MSTHRNSRSSTVAAIYLWCAISVTQSATPFTHAELSGETIEIRPQNLTFIIPRNWVRLYRDEGFKNLYVTREQLNSIREAGETEWDADYARILNATLPFEQCVAHAGGDGWGKDSRLYNDLQMRVYISTSSVVDVTKAILQKAVPVARLIAERTHAKQTTAAEGGLPIEIGKVVTDEKTIGEWHCATIAVPLWYNDYGGTGNVEFYVRAIGDKSITFVFMYASGSEQAAATISNIIRSFKYR